MIYGTISLYRKGKLVVFEKEWGKILGDVYREYVVPIIYAYKREVEQYTGRGNVILIEDGAPLIRKTYSTFNLPLTYPL